MRLGARREKPWLESSFQSNQVGNDAFLQVWPAYFGRSPSAWHLDANATRASAWQILPVQSPAELSFNGRFLHCQLIEQRAIHRRITVTQIKLCPTIVLIDDCIQVDARTAETCAKIVSGPS